MGFPAYEILSGLCRGVEECVGERCAGCDRLRFATPILIVDGHCIRTGSRGCPAGEEAHVVVDGGIPILFVRVLEIMAVGVDLLFIPTAEGVSGFYRFCREGSVCRKFFA